MKSIAVLLLASLSAGCGSRVSLSVAMRSDIRLITRLGGDPPACDLELEATDPAAIVPTARIAELVDEVMPPYLRGPAGTLDAIVCMGFCMKIREYQNVVITQAAQDIVVTADGPRWLAGIRLKPCQELPR